MRRWRRGFRSDASCGRCWRTKGRAPWSQAAEWTGLSAKEVGQSIRGLQQRGWAAKTGAELVVTDAGRAAAELPEPDETVLAALLAAESGRLTEGELVARGLRAGPGPRAVRCPQRAGRDPRQDAPLGGAPRRGRATPGRRVSARPLAPTLTPEMLASGQWREVRFKPYDVDLATEPRHPGKRHPLQRVIEETRRAFLEMGFEEWHSPLVESAFWDFDALFQPQDHPAREMQDTFYVARPERSPLPADRALVDRVRAHARGRRRHRLDRLAVRAGARRWPSAACCAPHTTATTIRALAADPNPAARKVFSVGPVFRRETIDYKHLPVFLQVDGIVIDANGTLPRSLGRWSLPRADGLPEVPVPARLLPLHRAVGRGLRLARGAARLGRDGGRGDLPPGGHRAARLHGAGAGLGPRPGAARDVSTASRTSASSTSRTSTG